MSRAGQIFEKRVELHGWRHQRLAILFAAEKRLEEMEKKGPVQIICSTCRHRRPLPTQLLKVWAELG